MRKTAVALAIACAFPALAFAQSARSLAQFQEIGSGSIVLYGIVDAGVEVLDAGDTTLTRIQGSGMTAGNRFGIRGSEVLGNGYSAIFTLEGRFSLDTGSVTYNESVYWCRLTSSTAAPVCPEVRVVPGTVISFLPPTSPTYQAVLGGLNTINNSLLQAITTVNSAGAIFDRQAFAGLVTPYGALLFGRQYTPGYEILFKYNVMQDMTALSFGQGYTNPAIRMNNALVYRAELKGFTLNAMYSFGGSESPASARNERTTPPSTGDDMYGINLQYNTTNWGVGTGWNQNYVVPYATQAAGTPEKKNGLQMFNLGAWVAISNFKIYGQYLQRKNDNPMLTPLDIQNLIVATGGNLAAITATLGSLQFSSYDMDTMRGLAGPTDSKAYHLGASWQFMPRSTLYAVYNYAKDTARSAWATQDASISHYGLSYQYQVSPRTALFGTVAFMANSDQARMTPSSAGYTTGFATGAGADSAAYQFGMRHTF
ncbi:MAG TPA: porin [Burkholderiaceae bacterium]|nr:porin [Burkholderiaceae bacterium]